MAPVFREDPYGNFNFEITLTGISDDGRAIKGSFAEASGMEVEVPPMEYRGGSEDITMRKLPGLKKFGHITLKRGIIGDVAFWKWILAAMRGQVQRTEGTIALLDENRQPVVRWHFVRAWPSKWTGPSLNAKNNEVAMETLVIAHEGVEMEL